MFPVTDFPSTGFSPGDINVQARAGQFPFDIFGLAGMPPIGTGTPFTPKGGAYLRTLYSPENNETRRDANNGDMTWGSEVELPAAEEKVTPPKTPLAPTIKIQAPTESNMGKTQSQRAVTPSQRGDRTPVVRRVEVDIIEEVDVHDLPEAALPSPKERDLPPPPSESIRSHRPSSVFESNSLPRPAVPSLHRGETPMSLREALGSPAIPPPTETAPPIIFPPPAAPLAASSRIVPTNTQPSAVFFSTDVSDSQTAYKTAIQDLPPSTPPGQSVRRDHLHFHDQTNSLPGEVMPWDRVMQRIYSWAMVWEESSFVRTMEEISLGKQVS